MNTLPYAARPDPDRDPIGPFLHYLMAECGMSPNTMAAYRSDIGKFSAWRQVHAPGPLPDITLDDLTKYHHHLSGSSLSSSSVCRHLASLSTFFRFLTLDGRVLEDIAKLLTRPATPDRLPMVLGPEAVVRLLNTPSPVTVIGRRDRALLEVLYSTGCRVSEVACLKMRDLDLDDRTGVARVIGKGDKERIVPLGRQACEALKAYIRDDRPLLSSKCPATLEVFLSKSGRILTRILIWNVVTRHALTAGLGDNVTPHTLRHSFATHLLAGGANLRVVQEILGHSSIASTQLYTRVELSQLRAIHAKCHPRSDPVEGRALTDETGDLPSP